MAKKRKSVRAEKSVLRDAKEITAVEGYWHAAGRPKSRKPPKVYKYVDELAHLQFELIKLQEWVRLHGLKVAVISKVETRPAREASSSASPRA